MTVVEVRLLFFTSINVCDFCVDVILVGGWSWNEEGTRINKAAVISSSVGNTLSIVDAVSTALSNVVLL